MLISFCLLFTLSFSSDLFEDYYERADQYLQKMTLEEKVNQIFCPKYNKTAVEGIMNNTVPGGFVLYREHFNYEEGEIRKYITELQNSSMDKTGLPLVIAVDEEGGIVNRISPIHRKAGSFPSPQNIYKDSGIEGILKIDQEKRDLLRKFLVNVNLAPVADISYNSKDYMYSRTLGQSPNITADYIAKDVEGYVQDNFTCCAKHFPGYGNNTNTHENIAIDNRSYEIFEKEDFLPFKAAIKNKIPMILVSHNIVKCKDDVYPASISKNWVGILRNDLNFSGIIVTDDLSMDAITKYAGNESSAILAVRAGNDLVITNEYPKHRKDVIEAVKAGNITEEVINKACKRVIAWKIKYIIDNPKRENIDPSDESSVQPDPPKQEGDGSDNTWVIVGSILGGLVVIIIVVFLIVHYKRKKDMAENEMEKLSSPIV